MALLLKISFRRKRALAYSMNRKLLFLPNGQFAVLSRIHDLVMDDSQFIIATHSPILMAYPNATIYSFSVDGIKKLNYAARPEHYQVTRDFLIDPKLMLNRLLEPSDKLLQLDARQAGRGDKRAKRSRSFSKWSPRTILSRHHRVQRANVSRL